MLRITLLALCCALFSTIAEARGRVVCDNVDVMRPCQEQVFSAPPIVVRHHPKVLRHLAKRSIPRRPDTAPQRPIHQAHLRFVKHHIKWFHRRGWAVSDRHKVGLAGVNPVLAAKVASIVGTCGSRVISTVRHTYVAGTRRISQHANGTAVDITGNPACIYGQLHGWEGGYSVDYGAVRHVHISIGGREAGARFVHGGGHRRHYAHHRHHSHWARG